MRRYLLDANPLAESHRDEDNDAPAPLRRYEDARIKAMHLDIALQVAEVVGIYLDRAQSDTSAETAAQVHGWHAVVMQLRALGVTP